MQGWQVVNNAFMSMSKEETCWWSVWIVRKHEGVVITHSSRAFSFIDSINAAKACGHLWAVESMCDLCVERVVITTEASELVGVITRPPARPVFRYDINILQGINERI